jgi:hypothetical protein
MRFSSTPVVKIVSLILIITTFLLFHFIFPEVTANTYPPGTVSVLHFNTTGSPDDEMSPVWSAESLAHDIDIYKFGGGSGRFTGTTKIYTADDPAFSPGSDNFTISIWVYPSVPLNGPHALWGNWWPEQGGTTVDFVGGVPRAVYNNAGTVKIISGTDALPTKTWSNVVLQGINIPGNSQVTLYVNGIPNGTITGPYIIRKSPAQTRFYIGSASTVHDVLPAGTYIDDFFMVVGGPAMYTGLFEPPRREFGLMYKSQESSNTKFFINKTITPRSMKLGTDAQVTVTIKNTHETPIYDIEISDTSLPEFPVAEGKTQFSTQILQPNESLIIAYTVKATKVGTFTLNRASVLFADQSGAYTLIQSDSPTISVLKPLISPTSYFSSGSENIDENYIFLGGIVVALIIVFIFLMFKPKNP